MPEPSVPGEDLIVIRNRCRHSGHTLLRDFHRRDGV